ncbi:alcohol dehydrogenase [Coprinellus micaceus]|uniref:Alcohol dehydrogenase n=1 Tax=Coprinellus micaceus TaxID=71717 RepID=A0A4Y7SSJ6_COPMI|nr:alcohol dehydrogenase [Coprinellus micaceus]
MAPVTNSRLIFNSPPGDGPFEPGKTLVVDNSHSIDVDTVALDGGFLLKILFVAPDPYLRGLMVGPGQPALIDVPPFILGESIIAPSVGVVVRSETGDVKVGDHICGALPAQNYVVKPGLEAGLLVIQNQYNIPLSAYLGVAGLAGMTAWMAWKEFIGTAKKGSTVFVSTAAGAVGSFVVQLAKLDGCKVIASTGSADRVAYIKEFGADVAFNYKEESTDEVLDKEGPLDIYWDNVGTKTLDSALAHAATNARFISCGMISAYDTRDATVKNLLQLIAKSITIYGLNVATLIPKWAAEFFTEVPKLVAEGKVKFKEHRFEGLASFDDAFVGTMNGTINGTKAIIVVGSE